MPRPKRSASNRQRCERACNNCKRRKEKCDGAQPCSRCSKRCATCRFEYSSPHGARKSVRPATHQQQTDEFDEDDAQDDVIDRMLNSPEALDDSFSQHPLESPDAASSEAPVPREARMLRDGRGKFVYIGDSASSSYLQNVRRVVSTILGKCQFTSDRLRHTFLEQLPPQSQSHDLRSTASDGPCTPNLSKAQFLVNEYLTVTSWLQDLFDVSDLTQSLETWVKNPSADSNLSSSIIYLVLAIGAQATPSDGYDEDAERYFSLGKHLVFSSFTEEPSMQTVQSYTLIAFYMLGACRRNASFMNLGIAVRAAYALGLHRSDIHPLFSEKERRIRARVWQSVRVLDLFTSASLGRPPSTSHFGQNVQVKEMLAKVSNPLTTDAHFSSAVVELCYIFDRILIDVYQGRSVSTQVAHDIASLYRTWTEGLPNLPTPLTNEPKEPEGKTLARLLASAHLIGGYYWSIILLTRPFLVFHVSSKHRLGANYNRSNIQSAVGEDSIAAFADSCVESAVKGLDVAKTLIDHPGRPKRLPLILNSVFNSALTIGLAFFGDYDYSLPLTEAWAKAERALDQLQLHDIQARRYRQIVEFLGKAANTYTVQRDRSLTQERSKRVTALFGTVSSLHEGDRAIYSTSFISDPTSQSGNIGVSVQQERAQRGNFSGDSPQVLTAGYEQGPSSAPDPSFPVLSTSGLLLSGLGLNGTSSYEPGSWTAEPFTYTGNNDFQTFDLATSPETMPMFNIFSGFDALDV